MISMMEISNAICTYAVKALPELKATYIEPQIAEAERPCLYIQTVQNEQKEASYCTVRVTAKFSLILLDIGGENGKIDTRQLLDIQKRTAAIFSHGFLKVKDRALGVNGQAGSFSPHEGYAQVDVHFNYFDDKDETVETYPLMKEVISNVSAI